MAEESTPASTSEKASSIKEDKAEAVAQSLTPEQQRNLEIYGQLDRVYRSAPADVREKVDQFFKGNFDVFQTKHNEDVIANASKRIKSDDPIERLESELKARDEKFDKLNNELSGLKNAYGFDKVSSVRHNTNVEYEKKFAEVAEENGYDYGSPAYDVLFRYAVHEGNILAKKYGLVDEYGNPDPLRSFKPELVSEIYQRAADKMKSAGFDVMEQKRRQAIKEKEAQLKAQNSRLDPFFEKEKLKTKENRAKQLRAAFNFRLRELGIDPNSLKIV